MEKKNLIISNVTVEKKTCQIDGQDVTYFDIVALIPDKNVANYNHCIKFSCKKEYKEILNYLYKNYVEA